MTADDAIHELYGVAPEAFTALRTQLAAAAKKRGDKTAAKRIGAARRPTTAAWVVNVLVRSDATAQPRLAELSDALRAAHEAMDGARIRELSTAQRKLVDGMVRAGFAAAGLEQPSAAMRDDVVGTLQAAIADPEVASRLGRLSKAERWSGFGEFGASTSVVASGRGAAQPEPPVVPDDDAAGAPVVPDDDAAEQRASAERRASAEQRASAERRRATAAAHLEVAVAAHDEARDTVADRRARVATARRRYEKLLETLSAAEHEVNRADSELDAAERTADGASDQVTHAKAELAEAEAELT